jgi:hypothetical protein
VNAKDGSTINVFDVADIFKNLNTVHGIRKTAKGLALVLFLTSITTVMAFPNNISTQGGPETRECAYRDLMTSQ